MGSLEIQSISRRDPRIWEANVTGLCNITEQAMNWEIGDAFIPSGIARTCEGSFVVAGYTWHVCGCFPRWYIFKFTDPDLVGVECPETYTILAAILLMHLYEVWRRTRRTKTPA